MLRQRFRHQRVQSRLAGLGRVGSGEPGGRSGPRNGLVYPDRVREPLRESRQFRRTLAWHIARRPGGVIAGALQYRHQAIQLFEGYAGTSDSGFRAEVESEQAIARGEHLLALIAQHDHGPLTGPAADEALRRLEELGERQRLAGQVVTDPRRLQRLMQRHDPAVYPGKYVTCVHSHAKALCGGDTHPGWAEAIARRQRTLDELTVSGLVDLVLM